MSDLVARLESTFGKVLPEPLFYNFDFALRFELQTEGDWPSRILHACQRARVIIDTLPVNADQLAKVLVARGDSEQEAASRFELDLLATYGCEASAMEPLGAIGCDFEYGMDRWAYRLTPPPSLDACLLSNLAAGCAPLVTTLPALAYLIDWQREIIILPYDDRGMDIVATRREVLLPLYHRFNTWLLEHDRARMDRTFGE